MTRLKLPTYLLWLGLNIPIFLGVNYALERGMFMYEEQDGFFNQMTRLEESVGRDLHRVHKLRYIAVYPFFYCWDHGYHTIWESVLLILYMSPLLLARFGGRYSAFQPLFLYLACVLSFRTVLSGCAMSYLFLHLFGNRRRGLFVLSGLLANLSSGTVLSWVLVNLLFFRRLAQKTKVLYFCGIAVLLFSFSLSVTHKIEFFTFTELPYNTFSNLSQANYGMIGNMLLRGTIPVSFMKEQYGRAALYCTLFVLCVLIVVHSRRKRGVYNDFARFFVAVLPNFMMEGQGPISYLIPIAWYFTYFHGRDMRHFDADRDADATVTKQALSAAPLELVAAQPATT